MPQVREYTRQVQESGLSNQRGTADASVEAFGGGQVTQGVQQAAQGLSNQMYKIAEEEKQKADNTATEESWQKLVTAKNSLLANGALQRKGKNALGVIDDFTPEFDKQADEIEKGLTNRTQREIFQKMRGREKTEFTQKLNQHISNESEQYVDATEKATIKTAKDEALLNRGDDAKVSDSLNLVRAKISDRAQRLGWDEQMTSLAIAQEVSSTRTAIVASILDAGNDLRAKQYVEKYRGEFTGEDLMKLEGALEEGSLRGESQRTSDAIMKQNSSLGSAMAAVRAIEDPKLRDATQERVKAEFAMKDQIKRDWEESAYKNAANLIDQSGGQGTKAIPPSMWASFSVPTRNALSSYANKEEGPSDISVIYDLKTQAAMPDLRAKFLSTNILEVKGLNTKDKLAMIELQADERRKAGALDEKLEGFMSTKQVVDEVMRANGLDPNPKYVTSDKKRNAEIHEQIERKLIEFQKDTGKKPTSLDVRKITDDLVIERTRAGSGFMGFFQDKKRGYEFKLEDISPADRDKIERALRAGKVPVTPASILSAYQRRFEKGN